MLAFNGLISSRWSSFSVTFAAVNWPGAVWLEGNFTFLSAVSAGCLGHLSAIHFFLFQLLYTVQTKIAFCQFPLYKQHSIKPIHRQNNIKHLVKAPQRKNAMELYLIQKFSAFMRVIVSKKGRADSAITLAFKPHSLN